MIFQEQSTIVSLLTEMSQEQKDQYSELEATAAVLRSEAEQARSQIDHLNREKEEFSREISGSQVRLLLGERSAMPQWSMSFIVT